MDIREIYKIYLSHPHICTDSRKIIAGCIFFALKGDNFDGNVYAATALEDGAAYAVIDDTAVGDNDRFIVVEDVLETLQRLATFHRRQLTIPVIAITGSNGKTTTKELCRDVLAKKYKISATMGNYNNHIGVPLTLLAAPRDTEIMLVEMGANHQLEIDFLCQLADPEYVMITNIGKAHMEGFGGIEGIKKGKSEMYRYAALHAKKIFINNDDEVLCGLLPFNAALIGYRTSDLKVITDQDALLRFEYKQKYVQTHLYGNYNLPNIAFAIAVGEYFGVALQDILDAVAKYLPENNRSQLIRTGSNYIIKDAYNANPTSMKLSIENFAQTEGTCKVLVLGDMLELGEYSKEEHTKIIELTEELGFTESYFIGKQFFALRKGRKGYFFTDVYQAREVFNSKNYTDTAILLKGSRGIAVEKILA